ncbi:MAG: M48 family metallopeptidase [Chloroflexota bacterium]
MTTLDPGKQQQAKEYSRIKRRLWLIETAFSLVYTLAWLIFGWGSSLRTWLTGSWAVMQNEWVIVPVFILIFGGLSAIFELPMGYYTGFLLPHRFDQSNQTLKDWILDQLKGLAISLPIGLIVIELLYLALRISGPLWWLWTAGGLLLFQVLIANLAPVLIMPIFNKFVPLGDEHAELAERLLKLAEKSKTKVKGVFTSDMSKRSNAANAFLTGIGNTRRIVLGDTLINEFSLDEIETVLAHELGHQVNNDIPLLIGFGTISTALGLYLASLAMSWAVGTFGYSNVADVAAFPALTLILSLYGLLTQPLDNAFSRWRETKADAYALQATGKNEALASSFTRLANQNLGEIDPEKWVVFMFYSHPPLGERIAMANNWKSS